jgi:hypothetical protein
MMIEPEPLTKKQDIPLNRVLGLSTGILLVAGIKIDRVLLRKLYPCRKHS